MRGLVLLVPLAACDAADEALPAALDRDVPAGLRLIGEAHATFDDGDTLDCALDWLLERRDEQTRDRASVTYAGVMGGHAVRTPLAADGAGFSFSIDVYAEIELALVAPDALTITIPINGTSPDPFYQALTVLDGALAADGTGAGRWRCAPLGIDQGGYLDVELNADGTWTVAPEDIPPPE